MTKKWPLYLKAIFIFLFAYLVLYTNSCQFIFTSLIEPIWAKVIPWFAEQTGHVGEINTGPTGSGDTTYDYYKLYFFVILSGVAFVAVRMLDHKRSNYEVLLRWLVVLVRYFLAMQMINYGFAKFFYMQFSFPSATRLDQPLGEFSPMGLLWTFMGYSKTYTMFSGFMELVGGLLLLSRRTTTLGALVTLGVMSNVMMMNYCYDIPVKLMSTHMVVMAIGLILLDGKRLLNFFFLHKPTEGYIPKDIVSEKYQLAKNVIKWIIIVWFLGNSIFQMSKYSRERHVDDSYFGGSHTVEHFMHYSDSLQWVEPADSSAWVSFYQPWKNRGMAKTKNNKKVYLDFEPDEEKRLFRIKDRRDEGFYELPFERIDSNTIHVQGRYFRDSIQFTLHKKNLNDYRLVNRKFRWLSERPFNR